MSCTNSLSGISRAFSAVKLQWNLAWSLEQQASFRAAADRHSGDWLHVLPIASCGLRLDDESVRMAVGLRLECNVCVPHACVCGTRVDACGTHSRQLIGKAVSEKPNG